MATVLKYQLELDGPFKAQLPAGAKILHVDFQPVEIDMPDAPEGLMAVGLFLWALADKDAPKESRNFWVTATGRPLPEPKAHLATLVTNGPVYHVFEMPATPVFNALGIGEVDLNG